MSEKRAPQEIVRMLNEYFELMVDVVFKHQGTLDKFVGDEIIALFGAPVAMPEAEIAAVHCALDMHESAQGVQPHPVSEGQRRSRSASASTPARWSPAPSAAPAPSSTPPSATP
jgi:adenylate cyclase